jgi:hypothetical protein
MSFDSWVKNSWLERLQSDAPEIARLLALEGWIRKNYPDKLG